MTTKDSTNKVNYHKISEELQIQILEDQRKGVENPYACKDEAIIRRDPNRDKANLWRPAFARDVEKIMNIPYYNRYADKTQVFSFMKNDDISRRSYHVQLVARQARNIGRMLNLNLDLIEAAALGHDIGHTPFGHAGERMLSEKLKEHTGRYFNHNVHSVRVLDKILPWNVSLQTLDAVLCHNGELELQEYRPTDLGDFDRLDQRVKACDEDQTNIKKLIPGTLEGCVVRVCDIIAYLGKDRQDAVRLGMVDENVSFSNAVIGNTNPEIINNMVVNIIENSYGKPYLKMDDEYFEAFRSAKKENGDLIYFKDNMNGMMDDVVVPMFDQVYEEILKQVKSHDKNSLFYKHHIEYIKGLNQYTPLFDLEAYLAEDPNVLTCDYIASMTDDYFVDLYNELFPSSTKRIIYKGYFEE